MNPLVDVCSDGLCDGNHDGKEHVLVVLLEGTMNLVIEHRYRFHVGEAI